MGRLTVGVTWPLMRAPWSLTSRWVDGLIVRFDSPIAGEVSATTHLVNTQDLR